MEYSDHCSWTSRTGVSDKSESELQKIDATGEQQYLSVGQIFLLDNPLLKVPLTRTHQNHGCLVTGARRQGLNFLYAHLNRLIRHMISI